ncbi:hypothetical protein ACFVVM_24710 [Nocardia sp. NPDC058176]|uniref:hypothetical protein n=1 Tax=Nocardia sp. NPDC058176 TaxID=3346368 RepID=UPI0036DDDA13
MSNNMIRSAVVGVLAGVAVVAAVAAVDARQARRAQVQFRALTQVDPELAALDAEIAARHAQDVAELRADHAAALALFRADLLFAVDPKSIAGPADLSAAQLLDQIKVVKAQLLDVRIGARIDGEPEAAPRETELATQLRALNAEFDGRRFASVYHRDPVPVLDERRYELAYREVHDGREWPHNTEYAEVQTLDDRVAVDAALLHRSH